jgi:hypothetical protein
MIVTESRSVTVWVFRPSISSKANQTGSFWPEVDSLDITPTPFPYVSCCRQADVLAKYERIRTQLWVLQLRMPLWREARYG